MNMFRSPSPEPSAADEVGNRVADDLIPLSHLALDMPEPSEGWPNFLGRRGIAFRPDRLGRDAITFGEARRLLDEQRENELRKAAKARVAEREAVEADQQRRAQIWKGVSADLIPIGVHPATAMLQAAKDARPRRRSPLEESLSGSTLVYHELPRDAS